MLALLRQKLVERVANDRNDHATFLGQRASNQRLDSRRP
jgi:hypothetical protein